MATHDLRLKGDVALTRRSAPDYDPNSRRDSLIVFQAKPLVWLDKDQNCHPLPSPDFEKEKRELIEVVEEVKAKGHGEIELIFEEATVDRLGAFLASGRSPVMHFSCHGDPEYLAIENAGAMQVLHVNRIRDFISAGSGHLKVVFVSACHSRPAGEAFVAAGVDHVVCCNTDVAIRDWATQKFAGHFYRALACGRRLKDSFKLALQVVLATPAPDGDSFAESKKFVLLPERPDDDTYHDVSVFYTSSCQNMTALKQSSPSLNRDLPPPPNVFVGREEQTYELVKEIKLDNTSARLILVKGELGIGKASLTKTACSYVIDRSRTFLVDGCEWVPGVPFTEISVKLHKVYEKIDDDEVSSARCRKFKVCIGEVVKVVKNKASLIVIDARELRSEESLNKLDVFLHDVFLWTHHVRAIVICPAHRDFSFNTECLSRRFLLGPLDFRSSMQLFGNFCDFVGQGRIPGVRSTSDLVKFLDPESPCTKKRTQELFSLIGDGNPSKIHKAATKMTDAQYNKLIQIGIRQLEDSISTVADRLNSTTPTKSATVNELQSTLAELNDLRKSLPFLHELEQQMDLDVKSSEPEKQMNCPLEMLSTATESSSPSVLIGSVVGVDFFGVNMDECATWTERIIDSKRHIEGLLQNLLRYGDLIYGATNIQVESIQRNGRQRAVVNLQCEIELRGDLPPQYDKRVRDICRKIARFLRDAGATEEELEDLMIGATYQGSLNILLEAPRTVFKKLYAMFLRGGNQVVLPGSDRVCIVSIAPAFTVTGPFAILKKKQESYWRRDEIPDAILWKEQDLSMLIPTSVGSLDKILTGGVRSRYDKDYAGWADLPSILPMRSSFKSMPQSGSRDVKQASHPQASHPLKKGLHHVSATIPVPLRGMPPTKSDKSMKRSKLFAPANVDRARDRALELETLCYRCESNVDMVEQLVRECKEKQVQIVTTIDMLLSSSSSSEDVNVALDLNDVISRAIGVGEAFLDSVRTPTPVDMPQKEATVEPRINFDESVETTHALSPASIDQAKHRALDLELLCSRRESSVQAVAQLLTECKDKQKQIGTIIDTALSSSSPEDLKQVLDLSDTLSRAIGIGEVFLESVQAPMSGLSGRSPPRQNDVSVEALEREKDVIGLVRMLSVKGDKHLDAGLSLLSFATGSEDFSQGENTQLREEIIASGGVPLLLALFGAINSSHEMKVVAAMTVAYLSSSLTSLSSVELGPEITKCGRYLFTSRPVTPRGISISIDQMRYAGSLALASIPAGRRFLNSEDKQRDARKQLVVGGKVDEDSIVSLQSQSVKSSVSLESYQESENENMITVMFSSPLVCTAEGGRLRPFQKLDFSVERELLWKCFEEAHRDIELTFDCATSHRLVAAIAKRCTCLHFSGGGHEHYLPFENRTGNGATDWFSEGNVMDMISSAINVGGAPFKFVFASTSHSLLVGKTFAKAGVPHVVCCQQNSQLNDATVFAFTRQFYLALAAGRTVKDSFEHGCKAISFTPNIKDPDGGMKKFALLPEDGMHDVPVFDARPLVEWPKPGSALILSSHSRRGRGLTRSRSVNLGGTRNSELSVRNMIQEDPSPTPPQFFLGREIDMHKVLDAILSNRLVSVMSPAGYGSSSLACALCHYINERRNTISFEEIIYVKAKRSLMGERKVSFIQPFVKKLQEAGRLNALEQGAEVEHVFERIFMCLREKRVLVVFDEMRVLEGSEDEQDFPLFLSGLVQATTHVKVLLTGLETLSIPTFGGVFVIPFTLGPLNFADTVRLFTHVCPHLHTTKERVAFFRALVTDDDQGPLHPEDDGIEDRTSHLFSLLGNGVPSEIEKAAHVMLKKDLNDLILPRG